MIRFFKSIYTILLEKNLFLQELTLFMPYAPSANNNNNIKFVLVNKSTFELVTNIDKNNANSINN